MPKLQKDGLVIKSFKTGDEFYSWLEANHSKEPGVWLRFYKKASGKPTLDWGGAVDVALCFGWIDSLVNKYDDISFIQKFTPRRPRSIWSKKNIENVERLIANKKMRPAGLVQIEAAKTDGRWEAAYDSPANMETPADFLKLLSRYPEAEEFYNTLSKANKYAIAFRLNTAIKPETRQKRLDAIMEMLKTGQKFH
ncbi:MAG TPA: YdeI/OmpD-associated family protein [Candidatus Saccharimonadales bacterium]|nr:YdeI/OmpD-associated family protein [Candidatus Saccharimonadales bacterium]